MTEYLDYSHARPGAAKIKQLGCSGVMRYLSHSTQCKDLGVAEARELLDAGLAIGLVWETTANRAGAGKSAGEEDRKAAEGQADLLGFPDDCPIFMAVDYDTTPDHVAPYFEGAERVAKRPVGVYGGYRIVHPMLKSGAAEFGWQTFAWSAGKVCSHMHLYQHKNGPDWDFNTLKKPFPVWLKTEPEPTPAPAPEPTPTSGHWEKVDQGRNLPSVIKGGRITTPFGVPGAWVAGKHTGDDHNGPKGVEDRGMPVLAPVEGRVVGAGWNIWPRAAYGRQVVIEDATGDHTAVCHLASVRVSKGAYVHAGDKVGTVGDSGNATGPHVHVERRGNLYGYWDFKRPQYDYPQPPARRIVVWELIDGSFCDSVYWLQRLLNRTELDGGRPLRLTGHFDSTVAAEVARFQIQVCSDPGDKLLGPRQLAKLLEVSKYANASWIEVIK